MHHWFAAYCICTCNNAKKKSNIKGQEVWCKHNSAILWCLKLCICFFYVALWPGTVQAGLTMSQCCGWSSASRLHGVQLHGHDGETVIHGLRGKFHSTACRHYQVYSWFISSLLNKFSFWSYFFRADPYSDSYEDTVGNLSKQKHPKKSCHQI